MLDIVINSPNSAVIGHIFNYPIRYYGIIMAISFVVGMSLVYFLFTKKNLKQDAELFLDYSPTVIVFSIIGARLFYILGSLDFYLKNPSEILLINHGGLSIFGAIIAGILTLFVLSKKKSFNFLLHCDLIAVVFPLCQAIGRFGNYFNQEAYGKPTDCFIKLFIDETSRKPEYLNFSYYHPTFLYESLLNLIIFGFLLTIYIKSRGIIRGKITCLYLCLYSLIRFLTEEIRIDSVMDFAGLHVAQILCIIVFAISLICLIYLSKKRPC